MIKYFAINDISRYITLFILLVIIRGLFMILFPDAFLIELHYHGIAEQLSRLGLSYIDVQHYLGPLSSASFRLFYGELGNNVIWARIFALLLCFFQVVIVTSGLNSVNGLKETNLFLGVIHIVLLHIFPDFLILSPMLIGMTLISITYIFVLQIVRGTSENHAFLYAGIVTSLAGGFLFPLFLFAIPTLLIIVVYTRFDRISMGLYILGLFLPLFFIYGYYLLNNYGTEYLEVNLYYGFSIRMISQLDFWVYILIGFIPTVMFGLGFTKIIAMYNMVNYQQKMIVASSFYLITAAIILFLLPDKTIYYFLLFIPFLIHFIGILIIDSKNQRKTGLYSIVVFTLILLLPFADKVERINRYITYKPLMAKKVINSFGRVLNLSEDKNILFNNDYATGLCEYMLIKDYFLRDDIESTTIVYNAFEKDMPDAIYDPNGIAKNKLKKIPLLQKKYRYIKAQQVYMKIK